MMGKVMQALGVGACVAFSLVAAASVAEYNPVRSRQVAIGPEASRLIVGFRVTPGNGADIPSNGSYTNTVAANALRTGPAGGNAHAAMATLTVTAPGSSGGGALDWWDTMFVVGVILAGRRHAKRRPPR